MEVIRREVSKVLELGVSKWATNHPSLMSSQGSEKSFIFNTFESVKVLEMSWNPQYDLYSLGDSFQSLSPT